jgi:polyisoprenoid-binding protein YceI
MKNLFFLAATLFVFTTGSYAQRYFTKSGTISFDATTPASPEKIGGVNRTVVCVVDTKTSDIQFSVLVKGFVFEKALMEEHFNENYMETTKFPKAEFRGTITNNASVNYAKDGSYNVTVAGKLTLHGETKQVEAPGKIVVQGGKIIASSDFSVPLSDYKISIPGVVSDKVAKNAKITVTCSLEPLKN